MFNYKKYFTPLNRGKMRSANHSEIKSKKIIIASALNKTTCILLKNCISSFWPLPPFCIQFLWFLPASAHVSRSFRDVMSRHVLAFLQTVLTSKKKEEWNEKSSKEEKILGEFWTPRYTLHVTKFLLEKWQDY